MNKRKVLSILLLALITVTLAVSCSGSIDAPVQDAEELAYVTFGNGHSRGLSTSYETEAYGSLYWFYTARKTDSYGTTGQVGLTNNLPTAAVSKDANEAPAKGLNGQVGPFSQGAWDFTLYAYKEAERTTLVYQSEAVHVILKGNEVKNVPVSVSLKGEKGLVNLSGAWFEWANNSVADGKISVTVELAKDGSAPITFFFGPLTISSAKYTFASNDDTKPVDEGYYTCTVNAYMEEDVDVSAKTVKEDATPLATQTLGLRVYGNATTFITGNLTEGIFAKVVFDVAKQDMKVFVPSSNDVTTISGITAVPDNTVIEGVAKSTTVEFEAGALNAVGANELQLDVKVTPVKSANEKFNITGTNEDNKSAFAGIDLTITDSTGTNEVSDFAEGKYATVTTYIAKGLSGVVVKYNGNDKDQPIATDEDVPEKTVAKILSETSPATALGYNPSTGLLRFKTNHFSEYYVLANCVALNITTNVGYTSLADAINAVGNDETIKLIRNSKGSGIKVSSGKKFTVDFNRCTYEVNGNLVGSSGTETNALQLLKDSTIVFKNGTLTSTVNRYNSQFLIQNYSNLTLDNMVVEAGGPFDYILSNNNGEVVIKDTTITSKTGKVAFDVCRYASYVGPRVTVEGNSVINGKVEISSSGHKDGARHELVVTDGTFNGSIYELGGSPDFVGSITGGTFSSDPSEYVAEGYVAVAGEGGKYTVQIAPVSIRNSDDSISYFADLKSALDFVNSNGLNNVSISLGSGSFSLPTSSCVNKTITITGTGNDTVLHILKNNGLAYQNGATLQFNNMTVQGQDSGDFGGLAQTNSVSYNSCKILGKLTLYGSTETFTDCVFENYNDYSIWTWGGKKVTLTGCTFNSGGKAVLLYGGAGSSESPTTVLTVKNCVFNDDDTLVDAKKAAIEIGNDYGATYKLNVTNANVNGFAINPVGEATGTTLWANKNSMDTAHLTVTIDGTQVH